MSTYRFGCFTVLCFCTVFVNGQILESNCSSRPDFSCDLLNLTVGECDKTTGICSCNGSDFGDCFSLNRSTNYCEVSSCYNLQEQGGTCKTRRSRTVSILLSIFLINFGAANFYIERYEYAIPQIILGLALCLFQFGSCAAAKTNRDNETTIPCIVCCSINSVVSLLFFSWWIADLIIFATNMRLDGQKCPIN